MFEIGRVARRETRQHIGASQFDGSFERVGIARSSLLQGAPEVKDVNPQPLRRDRDLRAFGRQDVGIAGRRPDRREGATQRAAGMLRVVLRPEEVCEALPALRSFYCEIGKKGERFLGVETKRLAVALEARGAEEVQLQVVDTATLPASGVSYERFAVAARAARTAVLNSSDVKR